MSGGRYGPVPAKLMFLSDLRDRPIGDKSGTLVLKHNYPAPSSGSATAYVNIDLILSSIKSTDTQIGEWVNIIGYITAPIPPQTHATSNQNIKASNGVNVQALVLWSAGAVNLGNYERILEERKEVERRLLPTRNKT
ncbi:MAG: hypothetical protein M1835_007914 [Candelina submexicana]|nr:MAG: hypothetical protein M1835_007914 [Candelina submexicana]